MNSLVPYNGMNHDEIIEEYEKCKKVYDKVVEFMNKQEIICEEVIYQTDRVIENAYEFIDDLFKLVKPDLDIEEYED